MIAKTRKKKVAKLHTIHQTVHSQENKKKTKQVSTQWKPSTKTKQVHKYIYILNEQHLPLRLQVKAFCNLHQHNANTFCKAAIASHLHSSQTLSVCISWMASISTLWKFTSITATTLMTKVFNCSHSPGEKIAPVQPLQLHHHSFPDFGFSDCYCHQK